MIIDIKPIINGIPKPDSINWYIYSDIDKTDLVTSKENDASGSYTLKADLSTDKNYYLFIEANIGGTLYKLVPYTISFKNKANALSNNNVETPIISVSVNTDNDGNMVSATFAGSDYNGKYPYANSIWRLRDGNEVIYREVSTTKTLTVSKDYINKNNIYTVELLYRDTNGLSNTILPISFMITDDNKVEYYYVVGGLEKFIDDVIERFLNKSTLINDIIVDNVLVSLVLKKIKNSLVPEITNIINKYSNGDYIGDDLTKFKDNLTGILDNLNIDSIVDKDINLLVKQLRDKYRS
jgi:hypothetical protein